MIRVRVWLMSQFSRGPAVAMALALLLAFSSPGLRADELPPVQVVASFSILADMVEEIGGEHVEVTTIVGPNGDAHTFEPSPQTVQALARAQVLVANGLGFEAWLPRLLESSGFAGTYIVASNGITPRRVDQEQAHAHDRAHAAAASTGHKPAGARGAGMQPEQGGAGHDRGKFDPHAWQDLKNGMVYAQNIADGLALADPGHAAYYKRRVKKYISQMQKLDDEVALALSAIPLAHRKAITAHDAFAYFGAAYGVEFIAAAGLSSEAEPSAKDIAALIDRARQEERVGIFTESTSNPKLVEQLAREAGVGIGGPLYSDALASPDQPAGTYLGMFHWNAGQLISVLKDDRKGKTKASE